MGLPIFLTVYAMLSGCVFEVAGKGFGDEVDKCLDTCERRWRDEIVGVAKWPILEGREVERVGEWE